MNVSSWEDALQVVVRVGLATLLGAVLGIDRDIHRKPAGLRVLSLVSLSASVAVLMSGAALGHGEQPNTDAMIRTIQGVLSGIGFLGAGVILRAQNREEVHGITTAATIWAAAILGMTIGMGLWLLGAITFAATLVVLVVGRPLENAIIRRTNPPQAPPPTPPPSPSSPEPLERARK